MQALVPASPVSGYTGKGVARWFIQTKATNNSCEMLKICNSTCWWKNVFFPPVWALVPQSFEVQGGIWHYAGIGRIRPVLQGLLQFPQDQCWKRQTLISNKFYISGEMMCVTQVENERRTNALQCIAMLHGWSIPFSELDFRVQLKISKAVWNSFIKAMSFKSQWLT